ncbi:hypothetical protein TPE_2238 [Treponema pedis str. T A4]|uniref:Uncharacterized protein n=1 Tax=Treponema pedis str. T A4 TaxID=1291379 RepID=S5ZPZ7_9SPIR|nr:hypothetical protein TPE_2238 [Treponema pedis str. T A4]
MYRRSVITARKELKTVFYRFISLPQLKDLHLIPFLNGRSAGIKSF